MLITDLPINNSIKIGRLWHKPRDIEEFITLSCRLMLFEASDKGLPLGRGGSATLIRFRGKDYVIATRHQLGIKPGEPMPIDRVETIRVASGSEGILSNIPLQRVVFEHSNPDEEFHDLLIFETADEWEHRSRESPYFFELEPFSTRQRVQSYMVGYPSLDVVMGEYLETFEPEKHGTIHIKRAIVGCNLDPEFRTNVRHYRRYNFLDEREVVDGFSGGAVFSLVGELGDHAVVLDGIVVRAGKDHVHIVDADYLVEALSRTREIEAA